MAVQSAQEFGWSQETAETNGAQTLLGWPVTWISAAQRLAQKYKKK